MRNKFSARLNVVVTEELKRKLQEEAHRRRRTVSSTVRVLLEEALRISNTSDDLERVAYEVELSPEQVARLTRLGYELAPLPDKYTQLPLPMEL